MKRSVAFVLALVLALSCLSVLGATAETMTMWVKTPDGKTLNVRAEQEGEIIGRLPYGTKVTVIDEEDYWWIIRYKDGQGYVNQKFLVETDPGKYPGPEDEKGNVLKDSALGSETVDGLNKQYSTLKYVTSYTVKVVPDTRTGTARLRWAPSKNSTLVSLVPAEYELTVLAENKNWLFVQDPTTQKIGFIAVKYTTPVQ